MTFAKARQQHALAERKKVERHPLVAAVLDRFPGAEVKAMTSFEDELRALTEKWRSRGMSTNSIVDAMIDEMRTLRMNTPAGSEPQRRER